MVCTAGLVCTTGMVGTDGMVGSDGMVFTDGTVCNDGMVCIDSMVCTDGIVCTDGMLNTDGMLYTDVMLYTGLDDRFVSTSTLVLYCGCFRRFIWEIHFKEIPKLIAETARKKTKAFLFKQKAFILFVDLSKM